jgi:hypothetical protein
MVPLPLSHEAIKQMPYSPHCRTLSFVLLYLGEIDAQAL